MSEGTDSFEIAAEGRRIAAEQFRWMDKAHNTHQHFKVRELGDTWTEDGVIASVNSAIEGTLRQEMAGYRQWNFWNKWGAAIQAIHGR